MLDLYWLIVVYQSIIVNSTQPCWMNYTNYVNIWHSCGIDTDYLRAVLLPWEYATGGYFSMFIAAIFVMFTYIKYHKAIYTTLVGTVFMPISYVFFPREFVIFAIVLAGVNIGILVWWIFTSQTNET